MRASKAEIDKVFTKLAGVLPQLPHDARIDLTAEELEGASEQFKYWLRRAHDLRALPGGKEAFETYYGMADEMERVVEKQLMSPQSMAPSSSGPVSTGAAHKTKQREKGIQRQGNPSTSIGPPQQRAGEKNMTTNSKAANNRTKSNKVKTSDRRKGKRGARPEIIPTQRLVDIGKSLKKQMLESKADDW